MSRVNEPQKPNCFSVGRLTLKELKRKARFAIGKWCNDLPEDGDYAEPEVITDRWSGEGTTPKDGDYAVIMIFRNNKEESEVSE